MKYFIHTSLLWFLTLSMIGLPVTAVSENALDLIQSYTSVEQQDGAASLSVMRCHEMTAGMPALDVVASHRMTYDSQQAISIQNNTHDFQMVMAEADCRCDKGCKCQSAVSCHPTHNQTVSAIIQTTQFVHSLLKAQLTTELEVNYLNCYLSAEVIPPIA
jgi:hypothetical protein